MRNTLKNLLLAMVLLSGGCAHAQQVAPATPVDAGKTTAATSQLGMNLSGINDWMTELPFVDVFRSARTWVSQTSNGRWGTGPKLNLDEHGWVKSLEPGNYAETPFLNTEAKNYPHGQYTLLYEGEGTIELKGVTKVIETKPGRIVFELSPKDSFKTVRIMATNPDNYIRNIHILMPGTEATYQKEPWNPVFLERWKNFNTFRFMDWMETNNSHITEWSDRPTMNHAVWSASGVPLEMMIDLCNRLGINPWFTMPHLASDEYVRQFALQVKRDLRPDLKTYIEYSNEIWNSQFQQTKWAGKKGMELGFGANEWEGWWRYSSYRSVQMFKIWEEVFGGRERLVRVMAGQAANTTVARQKLEFQEAYKHVDALASAPYFGLNIGVRNPNRPDAKIVAEEVVNWTPDQVLDVLEKERLPAVADWIKKHKDLADRYKIEHIAYEGGQHLVGLGAATRNEELTKLLLQVNRTERMGDLYKRYLDEWRAGGNGLFAVFASVAPWGRSGSWGLLESNVELTPKYKAVIEWNQNNPLPRSQTTQ